MGYPVRRRLDLRDVSPAFALCEASAALRTVSPGDWIAVVIDDERSVDELVSWSRMTEHEVRSGRAGGARVCWIRRQPTVPDATSQAGPAG